MSKKETIQYLTDLMATVQMAYFKGRMVGHPLWVHERDEISAAISIDLYHFGGDGEPVCEGLKPCTVTMAACMVKETEICGICYNPDNEKHPLVFLADDGPDEDGDIDLYDVSPDQLPEDTLRNVAAWLEAELKKKPEPVSDDDDDEDNNRPSRTI